MNTPTHICQRAASPFIMQIRIKRIPSAEKPSPIIISSRLSCLSARTPAGTLNSSVGRNPSRLFLQWDRLFLFLPRFFKNKICNKAPLYKSPHFLSGNLYLYRNIFSTEKFSKPFHRTEKIIAGRFYFRRYMYYSILLEILKISSTGSVLFISII